MTLRTHPARESPAKTLMVLSLFPVLAIVLGMGTAPLTTLVMLAVLFVSLSDYFFASEYHFGPDGISVRKAFYQLHYHWERFSGYAIDRNGILLSPFARRHTLENFRGFFLAIPPSEREQVVALLRERLKELP